VSFRVGVTPEGFSSDGTSLHGDLGLDRLARAGIECRVLTSEELDERALSGLEALLCMGGASIDARALDNAPELQVIARFGTGYDSIDLAACSRRGILVTNTPEAVRVPLASAALCLLLALSHNLLPKDRLVRESRWEERARYRGRSLRSAVLGIYGFGGVGSELARLAAPLEMTTIAVNRRGHHPMSEALGVELVSYDDLLRRSDYLVLCAQLTAETHHILNTASLAQMKPTACVINVGRGPLVDTDALRSALQNGRLAGAGLDVFDPEPLADSDELLSMENVVLSPHALCWTDDFTDAVATSALDSIIDVANGREPLHVVNPDAIARWRTTSRDRHN
jgi:phosphoglycerate dehydrogenase-like enzyme